MAVTIKVLKSWKPARLTEISDQLNLDRKGMVDLQDELDGGEPPTGWVGADHYAAVKTHRKLYDDLVDDVAEIAKVIGALDTAGPLITSAQDSLTSAIANARTSGFEVDEETGVITDTKTAENPDDIQAEVTRMKIRNNYVGLIEDALQNAADADSDLADALRAANKGDIDVTGTLADQSVMADLRGKSTEEKAKYLLDHPELGASLLPTLSKEVRDEIGEQLSDRTRDLMETKPGDPYPPDPETTKDELAKLNEQIEAYGTDDVVATSYLEDLGPEGLKEVTAWLPTLQLDDDFPEGSQDPTLNSGLANEMGEMQRNLGLLLDAGTDGLTKDGQSATDTHVSSDYVQQLVAMGDDQVPINMLNHYGTHKLFGYQLLAPLLHDTDSKYLLNEMGDGMLKFETDFMKEHHTMPWGPIYDDDGRLVAGRTDGQQWTDQLDGLRVDWTQGTDEDDPAGFDPMNGLLDGMNNNPDAARDFLTGDKVDVPFYNGDKTEMHESSRVDYLLTDRHWAADGTNWSQTELLDHHGPSNISRLGDVLQTATMEAPDDSATRDQIGNILDEIVHSTATDEEARGHDNLHVTDDKTTDVAHSDVVDPALRQDLGRILAYHSETTHDTFEGGDNSDVGPYGTNFNEGELRTLLADLGKDPQANEDIRVAGYEETVRQLKTDLGGHQRDPGDSVETHMDSLGNIMGAVDYGAANSEITASEDSDTTHNEDVSKKADIARDLVGMIPTGKNPVVSYGFDTATGSLIDGWEKQNQVDHSGDRDYDSQTYLDNRRLMSETLAEQTLLEMGYTPEQASAAAATGGNYYTAGVSQARGLK
ncbi:hypothetical protein ASG90_12060 [Nocardioides sp. Soil797]|nr:hypothetical protein ASG90_12060 [Nocardioides sp. Soil797]